MRPSSVRVLGGVVAAGLAFAVATAGCDAILGVEDVPTPGAGSLDGSVGGGDGASAACAPNALQCDGQQPQKCSASGVWESIGDPCAQDQNCTAGACGALCVAAQVNCNGQQPQSCDADGHWQNSGPACSPSQTCANGACAGVCGPAQKRCNGNVPQSCDASGQWQSAAACQGSTPYCLAGACIATPPSCAPGGDGMTNCGPGGNESCCLSLTVTGGTFDRTYVPDASGNPTGKADQATVTTFKLDKYDVTVGRFRQFVAAWNHGAGWTPVAGSGKHTHLNGGAGLANAANAGTFETGWDSADDPSVAPTDANLACGTPVSPYATWTPTPGSRERHPINCVDWFEAYAFCIWDGGFLPSDAELEYAQAGGSADRAYPWGSTAPGTACPGTGCSYAVYGCYYPNGGGPGTCTDVSNIAPVGTTTGGAGAYGQLDLVGNVWEWLLDWNAAYVSPCTDCAYLGPQQYRVVRSGFYTSSTTDLTVPSSRSGDAPSSRYFGAVGFRCARAP